MDNKMKMILLYVLTVFFTLACKDSSKQPQKLKTNNLEEKEEKIVIQKTITGDHCFRNINIHHAIASLKDVEELTLNIEDNKVTGVYNWLPAEKDKRRGRLSGVITGNRIIAQYKFSQEGIDDEAELIITITDENATITGGAMALGLSGVISRIDCDK